MAIIKKRSLKKNLGITIIELLAAVAIMGILGAVSVSVFSKLANNSSLDRDVTIINSYIEKARTESINSVNSLEHGIKFEANKITVFKSVTFSAGNTETYYDIPGKSRISAINLTGGATTVYFNKLTGAPSVTGTVVVSQTNGSETRTITIYATGIVDIQ